MFRNIIIMIFKWINNIIVFFRCKTAVNIYREYCYDEISLFVVLLSIVILVWFADFMPINIILLFVLSHIVYIGIRWYI
ncbi:MAG: hypothetical protein K2G83_06360, partial [Ruminococcus sp.]|nr:hypothetical protein [Ruminococcus sp.]